MYVCMRVNSCTDPCLHIHLYTYMHAALHMCVFANTYIYTQVTSVYIHIHIHIRILIHIHIHIHIHTHIHIHIHVHIHIHTHIHTYVRTYVYIYTHTYNTVYTCAISKRGLSLSFSLSLSLSPALSLSLSACLSVATRTFPHMCGRARTERAQFSTPSTDVSWRSHKPSAPWRTTRAPAARLQSGMLLQSAQKTINVCILQKMKSGILFKLGLRTRLRDPHGYVTFWAPILARVSLLRLRLEPILQGLPFWLFRRGYGCRRGHRYRCRCRHR